MELGIVPPTLQTNRSFLCHFLPFSPEGSSCGAYKHPESLISFNLELFLTHVSAAIIVALHFSSVVQEMTMGCQNETEIFTCRAIYFNKKLFI